MIDNLFEKLSVRIALSLLILELTYINSKSLLAMTSNGRIVDYLFAGIGALAFSMVTIIVMRKSKSKSIKIVFPIYDALLMFFGFNLHTTDYTSNAFYLSIFMSSFAGIITYSLGIISYQSHSQPIQDDSKYIPIVTMAYEHEVWIAKKKRPENLTNRDKWLLSLTAPPSVSDYLKVK